MINLKSDKQLNTEAIKLREKWGLNPNESIDITSVVLSKLPNLTLLYIPFSKNTSGMCIKDSKIVKSSFMISTIKKGSISIRPALTESVKKRYSTPFVRTPILQSHTE